MPVTVPRGLGCCALALLTACSTVHSGAAANSTSTRAADSSVVKPPLGGRQVLQLRQVIAAHPVGSSSTTIPAPALADVCRTVNVVVTTAVAACETSRVKQLMSGLGPCDPAKPAAGEPLDEPVVACGRDGRTIYLLAPAAMSGVDVRNAQAIDDATQGWLVELAFTGKGTTDLGSLTGAVTVLPTPLNQVAMILDGIVLSAPQIDEAITAGHAQITGEQTLTRTYAIALAARINSSDAGEG